MEGALRTGFTTGTCVTAAAKACVLALIERKFPQNVEVILPGGEKACFPVFEGELSKKSASCITIKDAGDDPDMTHAKEIGCKIELIEDGGITFCRGKGIGKVTLPGLEVAEGEPAINPVPRKMVSNMLHQVAKKYELECGFKVTPFVPEGDELAEQTFNPRIGVVGGISILGTSGKVIPYSNESFLETIKQQLGVVSGSSCSRVVLTSGKRSENYLVSIYPDLPSVAFVHFGNLIGESIKLAVERGMRQISLGIMFGKGIKLAEGHLNTHSKDTRFNPIFASQLAKECDYPDEIIQKIKKLTLANAISGLIPFSPEEPYYQLVAQKCYNHCRPLLKKKVSLSFYLLFNNGSSVEIGEKS
jgi:cobalt-precorrin-5B (C1)-methyltransferase